MGGRSGPVGERHDPSSARASPGATSPSPATAADLIIAISGTTDTLTITGQFETINDYMTATWWDVENFDFAGSIHKTTADVMAVLTQGTAGHDHIVGFYIADTLEGGLGDDLLEGGRAGDLYIHNLGDGHDTISDYVQFWAANNDRLLLRHRHHPGRHYRPALDHRRRRHGAQHQRRPELGHAQEPGHRRL